jgi:hypothetical protein
VWKRWRRRAAGLPRGDRLASEGEAERLSSSLARTVGLNDRSVRLLICEREAGAAPAACSGIVSTGRAAPDNMEKEEAIEVSFDA